MAKKTTKATKTTQANHKRRQVTEPKRDRMSPRIDDISDETRLAPPAEEIPVTQVAPKEHFYGDRTAHLKGADTRKNDPGSLDEETLSQDAPYNRTYGVQEDRR